jgi:energy-converting hydrogenase Eha subunit A
LARSWNYSSDFPEALMSEFLTQTITDMRSGRDSWRVVAVFSTVSFAIGLAAVLATT